MKDVLLLTLMVSAFMMPSSEAFASLLNLGPEEIVQADGNDIMVPGFSVPSFVDWDNDGKKDLIVGEGGGFGDAKVRVYLNVGTESNPQFSNYFCAQSEGFDLTCPAEGFMSCYPRVYYWDEDNRKDLLVGQPDGTVKIFLNIGTDENPIFDSGTNVKVGFLGTNLDVGEGATPTVVDWDNDDRKDLVAGALDGKIHIYFNCGCGGAIPPRFSYSPHWGDEYAQENGQDLIVPSLRSSPVVLDLNGDGRKDLLTGNAKGQLLFYSNVGTDEKPSFSGYLLVESNSVAIQVDAISGATPRSKPFVCNWTDDSYLDVLIGASDGKVHLYQANSGTDNSDIDVDGDGDVDFADFTLFAPYWRQTDCAQCGGADFTNDGKVDIDDLRLFALSWLTGVYWREIYATEDFETSDFAQFPWEHAGDASWAIAP